MIALIDAGANINIPNNAGATPLMLGWLKDKKNSSEKSEIFFYVACSNAVLDQVKLLISANASIYALDRLKKSAVSYSNYDYSNQIKINLNSK